MEGQKYNNEKRHRNQSKKSGKYVITFKHIRGSRHLSEVTRGQCYQIVITDFSQGVELSLLKIVSSGDPSSNPAKGRQKFFASVSI